MVKTHHKLLSLVLCVLLAVSALVVGTAGASAAAGETIYVKANWSNANCYAWNGSGETKNAAWPGEAMTKVADGVFSYTFKDSYANVIFNSNGTQTADLTYPGHGKIYDVNTNSWSDYQGADPTQPQPTTSEQGPTTPAPTTTPPTPGTGTTVYLKNEAGWSSVNCYMWNSSTDSNAAWPGAKMTDLGDGVFMYAASKSYANCIFNGGGTQTADLTAKDGQIYNNKTGTWDVYDVSPLRVTAYTADTASGVYAGSDVKLSATASNANGAAVNYKFSVKNASGVTTTISDFSSANSAVWTPKAAGSYTVVFDFKDAEGNTNSRTIAVTVEDDSALVKPVIKKVLPFDLEIVKVNSPVTVNVTAGGGKTGTNLLFYKYVVKDASGKEVKAPYYTLNNSYTFTPSQTGVYTVDVYVQGSDNTTVTKTYKYTAASNVPTTTAPITIAPPATSTPSTSAPKPTDPDVLLGDADGDGKVTVKDATLIQRFCAEQTDQPISLAVGDVDGDGKITVKDATYIQRMAAEL